MCVCVSLERLMKEITLQHQVIFPALDFNQIFLHFWRPQTVYGDPPGGSD